MQAKTGVTKFSLTTLLLRIRLIFFTMYYAISFSLFSIKIVSFPTFYRILKVLELNAAFKTQRCVSSSYQSGKMKKNIPPGVYRTHNSRVLQPHPYTSPQRHGNLLENRFTKT